MASTSTPSKQSINSFVRAAGLGETQAVTEFLQKYPQSINEKDELQFSALMEAAALGQKAMVELLLEKGADTESRNEEGWTVLMRATWNRHLDIVQILLDKGADFYAVNDKGLTTYELALQHCETPIVLFLKRWEKEYQKNLREQKQAEAAREAQELAEDLASYSPKLKRSMPAPQKLGINKRRSMS